MLALFDVANDNKHPAQPRHTVETQCIASLRFFLIFNVLY